MMPNSKKDDKGQPSVKPVGQYGPDLSIVLPVFEEQDAVQIVLPNLIDFLSGQRLEFEIIAVDDGSADDSLKILKELSERYPARLKVAHHLSNRGNGSALRTGIRLAQGEIVVTMDADGQHAAGDVLKLIEHIPPYDLVVASRTEGYGGSWYRNAANRFYNWFASWLTGAEIMDLTSGFRAMRRSVVTHFLPLFPDGFSAPTTTTMAFHKAGYNVAFVPIHVEQRTAGKSKIKLWEDGIRFVMVILRMIMLYDPLRIFLPLGLTLGGLGILSWGLGIFYAGRLVVPNSSTLALSSALMICLLGLIADQIANSRIQYHGDENIVLFDHTEEVDRHE